MALDVSQLSGEQKEFADFLIEQEGFSPNRLNLDPNAASFGINIKDSSKGLLERNALARFQSGRSGAEAAGFSSLGSILQSSQQFNVAPFDPQNFNVPLIGPGSETLALRDRALAQFTTDTPFRRALVGDPGLAEARNFFARQIQPELRSAASGREGFGGASAGIEARTLSNLLLRERDANFTRSLQATSQLGGLSPLLDVQQRAENVQLQRQLGLFGTQGQFQQQAQQQALGLAGLQTQTALNQASQQENIRQFNEASRLQAELEQSSGIGQLIGSGIGAAIGSFGGPPGVALGAQIGGSIGGAIEGGQVPSSTSQGLPDRFAALRFLNQQNPTLGFGGDFAGAGSLSGAQIPQF